MLLKARRTLTIAIMQVPVLSRRHLAAAGALACLTVVAGCAPAPDPRRTNFEIRGKDGIAKYDPKSGRLSRIDIDHDKDGRIETFSYWDGSRILRIEIDADNDGRIERWEHYDEANRLERVGSSSNDDGIEDTWTYPGDRGQLTRVETDTDRDGAIDKRVVFAANPASTDARVVSVVDLEIDASGSVGRRLHYAPDGTFLRAEVLR